MLWSLPSFAGPLFGGLSTPDGEAASFSAPKRVHQQPHAPGASGRIMAGLRIIGAALLTGLLVLGGCDKRSSERPVPSKVTAGGADAGVAEAAPPAQPPRAAQPALAPRDLDVAGLSKKLKCPRGNPLPCRVVEDFEKAGRWVWEKQSGTGRWAGRSYTIADGKLTKDFMVLWAEQVPTAQVGEEMLPLKVGSQAMPDRLGTHREKLIVSLQGDDAVSRHNRALPWVKEFVPTVKAGAMETDGASTVLISENRTYLRTTGRKTLLITPSNDLTDRQGTGTYAELWPATW
jgi:hypothetical protein